MAKRAQKRSKFFSIRVPDETRAELERAAGAHGRSFTAEIVARLEQSLDGAGSRFGDRATRAFSMQVAAVAHIVTGYKRTSWRNDQWTYLAFKGAVDELLSRLAPGGAIEPPAEPTAAEPNFERPEAVGRAFGRSLLDMIIALGAPGAPLTIEGQEMYRALYRDLAIGDPAAANEDLEWRRVPAPPAAPHTVYARKRSDP